MSKPKPTPSFGVRTFEKLGEVLSTYSHEAFTLFVACAACALSAGQREADYLQLVAPYKPAQVEAIAVTFAEFIEAADRHPFRDILGPVHMELGSLKSQQHTGEFYTPYDVCRMMAKMTFTAAKVPLDRPIRIQEPCSGAGQMILAAAEELIVDQRLCNPWNIYVEAWDISALACDMTFINLTLNGLPADIIRGDSLLGKEFSRRRTMFYPLARGLAEPHELAILNIMRQAQGIAELTPDPNHRHQSPSTYPATPAPDLILDRKGQVLMDI